MSPGPQRSAGGDFAADEAWARAEDAGDPLSWCRERFALPTDASGKPLVYFCGNSLGLMPKAARAMVEAELDDWARLAVECHSAADAG